MGDAQPQPRYGLHPRPARVRTEAGGLGCRLRLRQRLPQAGNPLLPPDPLTEPAPIPVGDGARGVRVQGRHRARTSEGRMTREEFEAYWNGGDIRTAIEYGRLSIQCHENDIGGDYEHDCHGWK